MNGESLGYGFVCFEDSNGANSAIREMNGKLIDGKNIFVALNKDQCQDENESLLQNQVYIKYRLQIDYNTIFRMSRL